MSHGQNSFYGDYTGAIFSELKKGISRMDVYSRTYTAHIMFQEVPFDLPSNIYASIREFRKLTALISPAYGSFGKSQGPCFRLQIVGLVFF